MGNLIRAAEFRSSICYALMTSLHPLKSIIWLVLAMLVVLLSPGISEAAEDRSSKHRDFLDLSNFPKPRPGQEICPGNDIEPQDFPGWRIDETERSNDSVGMCGSTAMADWLCYKLKKRGVFDKMPPKIKADFMENGCSPLSLYVQTFVRSCKDKGSDYTITGAFEIGREDPECNFSDLDPNFKTAAKYGLCPEKYFPSEFFKFDEFGQDGRSKLNGLQTFYRRLIAKAEQRKTEAGASLEGFSPEREIGRNLSQDQVAQIKRILDNWPKNQGDNFELVAKIHEAVCPKEIRELTMAPVQQLYDEYNTLRQTVGRYDVAHSLVQGNPMVMGIESSLLNPFSKPTPNRKVAPKHAVVAYTVDDGNGAQPQRNIDGRVATRCMIALKVGWGTRECPETYELITSEIAKGHREYNGHPLVDSQGWPIISCFEDGSYLVSVDALSNNGEWDIVRPKEQR